MDQQQPQTQTPSPAPMPTPAAPEAPKMEPKQNIPLIIGTYIFFFIPLFSEKMRKDPFLNFHMRQSLGLLLAWIVSAIIGNLPVIWPVAPVMQIFLIVLWFMAVISACQGKQELSPVVGEYFQKIKL